MVIRLKMAMLSEARSGRFCRDVSALAGRYQQFLMFR